MLGKNHRLNRLPQPERSDAPTGANRATPGGAMSRPAQQSSGITAGQLSTLQPDRKKKQVALPGALLDLLDENVGHKCD